MAVIDLRSGALIDEAEPQQAPTSAQPIAQEVVSSGPEIINLDTGSLVSEPLPT